MAKFTGFHFGQTWCRDCEEYYHESEITTTFGTHPRQQRGGITWELAYTQRCPKRHIITSTGSMGNFSRERAEELKGTSGKGDFWQ